MAKPEDLFRIYEGRIMGADQMELFAKLANITNVNQLQDYMTPAMQKALAQATALYNNNLPIFQNTMPIFTADILPTLRYLQNTYPKLYADISGTLTVDTATAKPKHRHKAIKKAQKIMLQSQKAYMLLCTNIIIGLEGVKEVAEDPVIKAGCVSLMIIFSSLLAYLKYSIEE